MIQTSLFTSNFQNPLGPKNSTIILDSGVVFKPISSGLQPLGSLATPFSTGYFSAVFAGGIALSNFAGGDISSSLTPTTSGTLSIGTQAKPFSGVVSRSYSTTLTTGLFTTGSNVVDWSLGASQLWTIPTGNTASVSLSFTGVQQGSSYVLELRQNSQGSRVVAWVSTKWPNQISGVLTTISGAIDLFTFYSSDGTTMYGNSSNNYK